MALLLLQHSSSAQAGLIATPHAWRRCDHVGAKNIIMELVHAANHYIETPLTAAKDPERRAAETLMLF